MEALGIDYKLILAQIVNFILFFLVVKKFIAKPFLTYMDSQKTKEKEKEQALQEIQMQRQEVKEKEKELMREAYDKSTFIIQEAKKEAETIKTHMLEASQKEALFIKEKGKKLLYEEKIQIKEELKKEVIETSSIILRKLLLDFFDEKTQKDTTRTLLEKLKQTSYEN